jgi:hypothetical protein
MTPPVLSLTVPETEPPERAGLVLAGGLAAGGFCGAGAAQAVNTARNRPVITRLVFFMKPLSKCRLLV